VTLPNIIFILLDDLGWRDLACYGSEFYETPNLDALARQGMVFREAYAAAPVCSPSRASLLTGRYPARVGVTDWIDLGYKIHPARGRLIDAAYAHQLPLEEFNLARALKQAGYATWHVGKWHLGGEEYYPEHQGFDVNIGGGHQGHPWRGYFSPWDLHNLPEGPAGEYLTDRLTDEAIRLIREHKGGPFFLNWWHYAVHTPIQAKPEDEARFVQKAHQMGLDQVEPFVEGEFFPVEHKRHLRVTRRVVQSNPAYAAMLYNLDWNVGRVLQALKDTGQADNTLIVFYSDNGGLATSESSPTCNFPLSEGKGWMYEGGNRVPLFFTWHGEIPAGSACPAAFTSPDLYPTLLELAGLPLIPEQHCDGASFAGALLGKDAAPERPVFWHYPHYGNQGGTPASAVRLGEYKLIEFFEDGRLELYHLGDDIGEKHNLAGELAEQTRQLHALLQGWRGQVDARLPEKNPDWAKA
jgi:arylsulfatase A-like enzyme